MSGRGHPVTGTGLPCGGAPGTGPEVELTSPGGPQPLIHQAGALICLPHTLLALMKVGLFMLMPVPLKLVVSPSG